MSLVVGVVVAIVVIVAIVLALSRMKKRALPQDTAETEPDPAAPAVEPSPVAPEAALAEPPAAVEALAPPAEKAEPQEAASAQPAVAAVLRDSAIRVDDKAEETAALKQEEARRERRLQRLRQGLAPTRSGFMAKIGKIFEAKRAIDPALLTELEETLIGADVGAKTTEFLVGVLRQALEKNELNDQAAVWALLREEIRVVLSSAAPAVDMAADPPHTIMVVGVNGVGKTTTIGKLATKYAEKGRKVVLAAADTFRAAAVNQLEIWGRRANAEVVKSKEGADPSAVVFDAIKKAKDAGAQVVIADTAGRLHTQQPLMEELKKIARVMAKAHEKAPHQVLLVLDATTGQNAIQQVAMFKEILPLSGIVLTKLDGTAKGGVIIGICHEHKIPVRYIGIGEAKEDLREFDVDDFVDALFSQESA